MPAAILAVIRPGTAPTALPRSRANSAVMSDPDGSAASTSTTMSASPAMIRLRAGKLHLNGRLPGGISETIAPRAAIRSCSREC